MLNRLILVAIMCTSCSWGLGELRGYDAHQREQIAREQHEAAQRILEADTISNVTQEAETIQTNAVDQIQRARIAQGDHNYKPKALPPIRSPEDDRRVQEYAGMSYARQIRRKVGRELPAKIVGGIASVVKRVVPGWPWLALGVGVFVSCGGMGIFMTLWRSARKGLRGMISRANDPEVKDHFRGETNGPAQREYRKMRDKGLL